MTTEENIETPDVATELPPDEAPQETIAEAEHVAAPEAAPKAEPERPRAPGSQERPAGERSYGDRGSGASGSRRRQQGKYRPRRRKVCTFCVEKVDRLDWKNIHKLRKFQTERGKIVSRRTSGTCARHQRQVTTAIHRARHMALLPYVSD